MIIRMKVAQKELTREGDVEITYKRINEKDEFTFNGCLYFKIPVKEAKMFELGDVTEIKF